MVEKTATVAAAMSLLGTNIHYLVKDGALVLHIPLDAQTIAASHPSKSGKNRLVASTAGVVPIPGTAGIKLGLNLIAPLG